MNIKKILKLSFLLTYGIGYFVGVINYIVWQQIKDNHLARVLIGLSILW